VSESADSAFDPEAILRLLLDHGVEFIVVGGLAVQSHGHLRTTTDLDVIPAPDLLNLSRLSEALAALGAGPADPHVLRRAALVSLTTDHGRLDLLNVGLADGLPKSYEELRGRAVEVDLDGRIVAVAGLDDLIRMKRATGRDVDLSDIGALTRSDEQLQDEAREST
jgi:predicted nucleotidyltransferase